MFVCTSRTILVKAIAHAIPSYAMSSSLFTVKSCNQIDAIIRKFWWGTNANGNALMLKCWDSICSPKCIGGMGFRRMRDLNLALFSKFVWQVSSGNNKLWINIIKNKYLRGKNYFSDNLSHNNASWFWTDLSFCRSHVKNGAIFCINRGSDVMIWNEPWIPTIPGFIPVGNACYNPNRPQFVKDLMFDRNCDWNLDILNSHFPQETVKEILSIHISPEDRPKKLLWSPSKSEIFSTRSFYLHSQSSRFNVPAVNPCFKWKTLWNAKFHNRYKLLLWKLIHNILPCKARLNLLFATADTSCYFCNHHTESVDHLFLKCPFIQQIWFCSFWQFNASIFSHLSFIDWINILFDNNKLLFPNLSVKAEFTLFTVIMYDTIWFARNKLAHGSLAPSIQELVVTISREARSHWLSMAQTNRGLDLPAKPWKPPDPNWTKVNVDATFKDGIAHSGVVFRNCNGSIFHIASHKHLCQDPVSAESLAILDACKELESANISYAIIESDCINAISFITTGSANCFWSACPIIDKIRCFKIAWPSFVFAYISRKANGAAHAFAHWAANCNFDGVLPLNLILISVLCDSGYPLVVDF
ncbi:hypothetical protein CASFOL_039634 [Castilleja foliolosa]|uniref:Reverse transcriptase zinc-binding domain-containing protein n=1 Tax=Castilleja foliolosa TaxID=1961234 RepID=A0ABD3BG32_9LAMI